jgi:predicted PurR-regulated permease PerM
MSTADPRQDRATRRGGINDRAGGILAVTAVLAILYFARDVLVPITLALILSLLLAPILRGLRRLGLGHTSSVLATLLLLICALGATGSVIGTQLLRMAQSLPAYEQTLEAKFRTVEFLARRGAGFLAVEHSPAAIAASPAQIPADAQTRPIPVQVETPPPSAWSLLQRIAAAIWIPFQTAGIVLIVLVFVLLEHEGLRDRLIRIAGSEDLRATTNALNDAGLRLSRFFVSQFLVNLGVGAMVGIGLALIGLPHALFWAAITLVLRFVPYLGVWIAALFATLLAAAVAPSWSLSILTISTYAIVELIAAQLVEPQLYGHTTGLSPLTVVIAAIFWSWLWGPIGLIVSTPITLCLLVAGRHTKALSLLEILLGDTPALTMPQRLYQRALSADSTEIIASARAYLKRNSFAAYCDSVLVPALQLARFDFENGLISDDQQIAVRNAVISLIGALGEEPLRHSRRRQRTTVLDDTNLGRALRREREQRYGRWQGPLDVPKGSIVLCVGLGTQGDELAAELLVRILRAQHVDARHVTLEDLEAPVPSGVTPGGVSITCIVSTRPGAERGSFVELATRLRTRLAGSRLMSLIFPGVLPELGGVPDPDAARPAERGAVDRSTSSFVEALQVVLEWQVERRLV